MPNTTDRQVVKVGDVDIIVVPQKHARLRRRLSAEDFGQLMSANYAHEAYRVLGVLIPDLHKKIKEHEWEGFAKEDDWRTWVDSGKQEDPRSDEQADQEEDQLGPTTAEIVLLFETAFKVSGAQRLGKLVDLFMTTQRMQDRDLNSASEQTASPTPASPALPGDTGASA
jgi:hypothetical protein